MATSEAQLSKPSAEGSPARTDDHHWDKAWRANATPWDRGQSSDALHDLLQQRPDLVPPSQERDQRGNLLRDETGAVQKKTALVPGCGRGHDVLLLSSWGYDVWGLDLSDGARTAALEHQKRAEAEGLVKPLEDMEKGAVHYVTGDFFDHAWNQGAGVDGKFDLIFDYTFLCALNPDKRPSWAKRMTELLAHNGRLVCLEFPSGKPLSEKGPPWGVSPELYEALLGAPGEPVHYEPDGTVVENTSSKPVAEALHRISLIKPSRTHQDGTNEDGSIRDFISVWSR